MFAPAPGTTDYIRTGKLRALAVTAAARAEVLPELPPVGDFVPGYETSQWYGMCAPKKTPQDIVDKLNKENNTAIARAAMKARPAAPCAPPPPGSPPPVRKTISEATPKR